MGAKKSKNSLLALEEVRFQMEQMILASDSLEQKINHSLTIGSLILAILSTTQLFLVFETSILHWTIYGVAFVAYLAIIVLSLFGILPKKYRSAIEPTWIYLAESIIKKSNRESIQFLLSGYIDQLEYNKKINKKCGFR